MSRGSKATHFLLIFIAPGCYESIKKRRERKKSYNKTASSVCIVFLVLFCRRRCNVCALPLAPNIAAAVAVVLLPRCSRDMQIDSQPHLVLMENARRPALLTRSMREISIMQLYECFECCGRSFLKSKCFTHKHHALLSSCLKKISDSADWSGLKRALCGGEVCAFWPL